MDLMVAGSSPAAGESFLGLTWLSLKLKDEDNKEETRAVN